MVAAETDFFYYCFSFVIHYVLEEKTSPSGKVVYTSEKQGHKYLTLVSLMNLSATFYSDKFCIENNQWTCMSREFLFYSAIEIMN